MKRTLIGLLLALAGASAFAQQTPNPVAAGAQVTLTAPAQIAAACAACNVFIAMGNGSGTTLVNAPTQLQSFLANTAVSISSSFTVPLGTPAGSYPVFFVVTPTATGAAMVGQGQLGTVVVGAAAAPAAAGANQLSISWAAPTSNTDGSTPAAVSGYNVYVATSDAALTAMPSVGGGTPNCTTSSLNCATSVAGTSTLSYKTVGLPAGTYYVAVTAWYCPGTSGCTESAQSAHVNGPVTNPVITPNAPGSVSISATVTATSK